MDAKWDMDHEPSVWVEINHNFSCTYQTVNPIYHPNMFMEMLVGSRWILLVSSLLLNRLTEVPGGKKPGLIH